MKAAEIRALNADEREEKLRELYGEWRDLRFQEAVGQMTGTSRIREIRKDIARIKTIQGEAERTEKSGAAQA
ncbi:MAG TPA: 50S ribosomal protein L29 [Thermomicrobiales bacterium]|nr:50S ribosomal protein L29 [Thermomicrobiales bacterium]